MTVHVHVSGTLAADPVQRIGQSGKRFTTASIRSGGGDEAIFVNLIAFREVAERLAELRRGDAVSVSGRGELRSWTAKDGSERTSLAIAANEIAAAKPRPRAKGVRNGGGRSSSPRPAYPRHRVAAQPVGDDGGRPFDDRLDDIGFGR